ncbi:MAG: class I SAM-dependent methyltransferase [Anaerolineae bacterium]|nr:class I SAM-dependent methyltransferase [Thermoflexales bacterium]MDW8395689.1 class I SAM-dependent methyltransferase [Anaerolineae bacterium]
MPSSICFDRAAAFYDQTRGFPPGVDAEVAQLALQLIGGRTPILEVGVGTGRIARPMIAQGARVVGIDLSRAMMKQMRLAQPDAQLIQGDAMRLPFADACFDAVVAVHVFHLVGDWQVGLREARRVLRPEGVLLIGNNHHAANPVRALRNYFEQRLRPDEPPRSGWRLVDEVIVPALLHSGARMHFVESKPWTTHTTPRREIEALRQRLWSSTWSVDDEQLGEAIADVEALALAQFGDLDTEVELTHQFHWRCFEGLGRCKLG